MWEGGHLEAGCACCTAPGRGGRHLRRGPGRRMGSCCWRQSAAGRVIRFYFGAAWLCASAPGSGRTFPRWQEGSRERQGSGAVPGRTRVAGGQGWGHAGGAPALAAAAPPALRSVPAPGLPDHGGSWAQLLEVWRPYMGCGSPRGSATSGQAAHPLALPHFQRPQLPLLLGNCQARCADGAPQDWWGHDTDPQAICTPSTCILHLRGDSVLQGPHLWTRPVVLLWPLRADSRGGARRAP